jgi:tryptophan synthase alpha chain
VRVSEVDTVFAGCRRERRAAFVPYLVAGDPDLDTSVELARAAVAAGADLLGFGVAFTDPILDGPITRRAGERALEAGGSLSAVLRLVARHRDELGVPVVLFSYCNPLLARGAEVFAERAASSGVDAVVALDLPPEEGERELGPALRQRGVDPVYLLAADASKRRTRRISESSRGFVLGIPARRVTTVRRRIPRYLLKRAKRMARRVDLPLVAGLGLATPEQVEQMGEVVDGVVVGGALALLIERHLGAADLVARVEAGVRELRSGLGQGRRRVSGGARE